MGRACAKEARAKAVMVDSFVKADILDKKWILMLMNVFA